MVYKFFDKKLAETHAKESATDKGTGVNTEHLRLEHELHKQIISKFGNCMVHSSFKDNILGVDLANMQLISQDN